MIKYCIYTNFMDVVNTQYYIKKQSSILAGNRVYTCCQVIETLMEPLIEVHNVNVMWALVNFTFVLYNTVSFIVIPS